MYRRWSASAGSAALSALAAPAKDDVSPVLGIGHDGIQKKLAAGSNEFTYSHFAADVKPNEQPLVCNPISSGTSNPPAQVLPNTSTPGFSPSHN